MDKILVLDFGGQYNQLIARRVRELGVYAEIAAYDRVSPGEIQSAGYRGVIFTGVELCQRPKPAASTERQRCGQGHICCFRTSRNQASAG